MAQYRYEEEDGTAKFLFVNTTFSAMRLIAFLFILSWFDILEPLIDIIKAVVPLMESVGTFFRGLVGVIK